MQKSFEIKQGVREIWGFKRLQRILLHETKKRKKYHCAYPGPDEHAEIEAVDNRGDDEGKMQEQMGKIEALLWFVFGVVLPTLDIYRYSDIRLSLKLITGTHNRTKKSHPRYGYTML